MKHIPLALAGLLAATAAFAQPASPPVGAPPPPGAGSDGAAPPPPPQPRGPGSPRAERPAPPPPHGASFHLAHGADGGVRLDIECAERDATSDCAEIAGRMLDRLDAPVKTK